MNLLLDAQKPRFQFPEPSTKRRRVRRSPRYNGAGVGGGVGGDAASKALRRKSMAHPRSSIAKLSIDLERGLVILREPQEGPVMRLVNSGRHFYIFYARGFHLWNFIRCEFCILHVTLFSSSFNEG